MPSCLGSVCLLLVMGALLAHGNPLHNQDELKHLHESISDALDLQQNGISNRPLFSSVINSINTSCQRKEGIQLLNVTLGIYLNIFSSILEDGSSLLDNVEDRSQVESKLRELQRKTQNMKNRLNHQSQQNRNKEEVLQGLNRIQVNEPNVQKKALAQFLEVYEAANVISHGCGHARSSA